MSQTRVRRRPTGFKPPQAVMSGKRTDTTKSERARGQKSPSDPSEAVGDIPRALGKSVTPPSRGYAVRRRVLGRVLRREPLMQKSRHDDSENHPRTNAAAGGDRR